MKRALQAVSAAVAIGACAFATPAVADGNAPSAFVQCDGRTGHVSDGARFLRVLLVSATAGLSEAGMSHDDASKRAKGAAGVAACDQAIKSEGDAYRRIQLALARALHFGEDKSWDEAAQAASEVPQQLGTRASDWGLSKSATSTARFLQALFLVRAGKIAEAQEVAWQGVDAGGLDVLTMQRMSRFVGLSRTLSPGERQALQKMQRYYPDSAARVAAAYSAAGEFKSAAAAIRGWEATLQAFAKDPKPLSSVHSMLATLAAMDGNIDQAKAELAIAQAAQERARAAGLEESEASNFASREDEIAFAQAAISAASGDYSAAAKVLSTRGSWPTLPQGLVATLVGRVAPNVPESARTGVLAKSADQLWQESLGARLALLRNSDHDALLWNVTGVLEQDEAFGKLARAALTGGGKAKWLVKAKEPRDFDVLVTDADNFGWESGEALLYHAALMAKARGKQGFVVFPKRDHINWVMLRFVNPEELGIPAASIINSDEVIAALSPHIVAAQ